MWCLEVSGRKATDEMDDAWAAPAAGDGARGLQSTAAKHERARPDERAAKQNHKLVTSDNENKACDGRGRATRSTREVWDKAWATLVR